MEEDEDVSTSSVSSEDDDKSKPTNARSNPQNIPKLQASLKADDVIVLEFSPSQYKGLSLVTFFYKIIFFTNICCVVSYLIPMWLCQQQLFL